MNVSQFHGVDSLGHSRQGRRLLAPSLVTLLGALTEPLANWRGQSLPYSEVYANHEENGIMHLETG